MLIEVYLGSRVCLEQLSTTYPKVVWPYVVGYFDFYAVTGSKVFGVHQADIRGLTEPCNISLDGFLDLLGGAFLFFIVKPT